MEPERHPQVEALLGALRQLLRARGLRYRDVATRLGVTERTVKRWFADEGLTMNVVANLCSVLGVSLLELCEVAGDDLDIRPQVLGREQERQLFSDLQRALVFILLTRGWSPQEVQRECGLPEATLVRHLTNLEKIGVVELLPGNKIRLLFGRNIKWQENGEAGRAFARGLKHLFAAMDYSRADAVWSSHVYSLSPRSLAELRIRFRALLSEIQAASDADRRSGDDNRAWHAILLAAHPFDPLALGRDAELPGRTE